MRGNMRVPREEPVLSQRTAAWNRQVSLHTSTTLHYTGRTLAHLHARTRSHTHSLTHTPHGLIHTQNHRYKKAGELLQRKAWNGWPHKINKKQLCWLKSSLSFLDIWLTGFISTVWMPPLKQVWEMWGVIRKTGKWTARLSYICRFESYLPGRRAWLWQACGQDKHVGGSCT